MFITCCVKPTFTSKLASIAAYFALMMNNAWNLHGSMDANKKKGWKGDDEGGSAASRAPARGGPARA